MAFVAQQVSADPTGKGGDLLLDYDLVETASIDLVIQEADADRPESPAELEG